MLTNMGRLSQEISVIATRVAMMAVAITLSATLVACAGATASSGPDGAAQAGDAEPEPAAEGGAMTILDGVYTSDQADQGEDLAQANCMMCHSVGEWSNGRYVNLWSGRSVGELFDNLEGTMPYDEPGRLTRGEYAAVIAYMFSLSDLPTGDAPLPSDADGLAQIQVVRGG